MESRENEISFIDTDEFKKDLTKSGNIENLNKNLIVKMIFY